MVSWESLDMTAEPAEEATSEARDGAGDAGARSVRGLATVAFAIVTAILPVFLLGSMSVEIRRELGHGESTAGLVLAAFFGASALVSSRLGRWIDHVGPRAAFTLALGGAAAVDVGIAVG